MPDTQHSGDSVYRMLFESAGDAIFVHTENKILAVNRKACEILGYTEDELLLMSFTELNQVELRMYLPEHMAKLKKHSHISFETTHQKKDGTTVPVEVMAQAITWGGESSVMSICRDNTVKRHFDDILLKAAMEWQNTFDAIEDSVFLRSPDHRILRCNKASYAAFGKEKPGEMLGKFCWEVVHGTSEQLPNCPIVVMEKTKRRESAVFKSGERWLEVTVDPVLDEKNNITGAIHVVRDLTERKLAEAEKAELEERGRQLQKAESLERMASAISHHFNNQLHVVTGYLGLLIDDMPPGDFRIEKITNALQAARKASEVSGLLISFLSQKQGKLELIDLAGLCRMNLPILQAGKPKDVALETDLPSSGPVISADAKQIQQLLTNLIINAWEATGDGAGAIHLSVRTVSPAIIPASHRFPVEWHLQEQPYACLEVMDSGCGIQEKDMEKIFDPFFSTKPTGMGLGLSVVLGIVKTHDAVITAERRTDGGSVFRVFFPLSVQTAPRRDEQVAKAPGIVRGGTVLLVEDEDSVRRMTGLMLVKSGFKVLLARDGVEAVEIFGQHRDEISCLLCDLSMPRMGGWETISALRAIRHDLPVVLSSGYDEASVMAGEHPELPDFYLNKPYDLNKLGDTIRHVMALK